MSIFELSLDDQRSQPGRKRVRTTCGSVLLAATALLLVAFPAMVGAETASDPKIGVSPSQLQFGSVESTKTKSVKIRNQGKADLTVDSISPCVGTSNEFSWSPPAPFTVAPKERVKLEVSYTPADDGEDRGCLEIVSNDPKRPTVKVSLRGRAVSDDPPVPGPDIDLQPDALAFGEVSIGGSATRTLKVKNKGTDPLEAVMVGRCFETSTEFSWSPTDMFSVPPDENVAVQVTYAPVDAGLDEGCLQIVSNDPDENPAVADVSGSGVEAGEEFVDIDITQFKVKKNFESGSADPIFVHLWVRNEAGPDVERMAIVSGMQGGVIVYEESLMVSDKGGNRGSRKYAFPTFMPTAGGEILWLATVLDDDADIDEALAVTQVAGAAAPSVDVDLDAVRLKATKKVSLARGKRIRLRVWIENPGSIDEARLATLTGVQGGVEVYNESLEVADMPGDDAAKRYAFPAYAPNATGDIVWSVTIADDDPDVDLTSAVSRVNP